MFYNWFYLALLLQAQHTLRSGHKFQLRIVPQGKGEIWDKHRIKGFHLNFTNSYFNYANDYFEKVQ